MHKLFWLIFGFVQFSLEVEINITKMENCDPLPGSEIWPVEMQEVHYDYNENGFIDHIHGKYLVRTIDTRDKELTIIVYHCSIEDPQPCEHKIEHVVVDLHCEKFKNDNSGIWHMISRAMTGSTCGEETGLYDFEIDRMSHDYFKKYLIGDEQNARYRMNLIFHKKDEETKDRRACAEIHFDLLQY